MTNILLVDDHAVVRKGVRAILESSGDPVSVAEAATFEAAVVKLRRQSWDAVVLDISLPGKSGLNLLKQIKQEYPSIPVLILSVHPDHEYGIRALKIGAAGYLDKSTAPEQLLDAVNKILKGKRYISTEFSEILAAQMAGELDMDPSNTLTNREFEVFRLISVGNSTAEVARTLSISPKTVHSHRRNILEKLALNSNAEIVRYAMQRGLIA